MERDINAGHLVLPIGWVYGIVGAAIMGAFWVSTLEVRVSDMRPAVLSIARTVEINSNRLTKLETQIELLKQTTDRIEMALAAIVQRERDRGPLQRQVP